MNRPNHRSDDFPVKLTLAPLVALFFLAPVSPCQAASEQSADHLNTRPLPAPEYLPDADNGNFVLPPVAPATPQPSRRDGTTINLQAIRFEGNTVASKEELARIAEPFVGRPASAGDLEDLRTRITRHYVAQGYVNSGAVLREGAYKDGVLTIQIIEGRLQEVHLKGMDRLWDGYVTHRLSGSGPLNTNDLQERFQLLLTDPLIARMNGRLLPGSEPGSAILDIDVTRARPYQFSILANNYRPPSIGSEVIAASGWVRNLTGLGDLLDFSYQDGHQSRTSDRYGLGWRVPVTPWGTHASVRIDHGRSSVIEEPLRAVDIRSTIDSREYGLSQTLFENLRQKAAIGITRSERENRTTLLGMPFSFVPGEPNGVTKADAWRFWQDYVHRWESQVLALKSTFSWGKTNIQPLVPAPPVPVAQPDRDYRLWLGQIQYAHRVLDNNAQVVLRTDIQETSSRLTSLERMSIGGVYTVRGYRENTLVRDTGTVASIEFHYPVIQGTGHSLTLIPFLDRGSGRNIGEARQSIKSAGLALNWRYQGLVVDLAKGWRGSSLASNRGGNLQDDGIHLQVRYDFF